MTAAIYVAAAIVIGVLLLVLFFIALSFRFRGTRVVTCPETKEPVAVELDAAYAAMTAVLGQPSLRLQQCSRWPERQDCGQECLNQIEESPEDCLVRRILTRWYQGKSCVFCGKPLEEIHLLEHKPALMSPEHVTIEWRDIRPENLMEVLSTHMPACWNCHIAETFRRRYPELVVDRSWRREKTL